MSRISRITDYDAVTLNLILDQYKESPRLQGVVRAANTQAEDLEEALFEIRDRFRIDTAEGAQLDTIGRILREERGGRTDEEYRQGLKARGAQTFSAEPEAIIGILKALFGATYVEYTPEWNHTPAQYNVRTDADVTEEQLQAISPAGVLGLLYGYLQDGEGNTLTDALGNPIGVVSRTGN